MTYIKWKDEVEGYLISLPAEEKQRIFSYFSEMYADKRDAGKSEAQIIEEFGAPYDVAKRILEGSKEGAPAGGDNSSAPSGNVSGGNNYNYNYYNYNYGGAPQPPHTGQTVEKTTGERTESAQTPGGDAMPNGVPLDYIEPKPRESDAGRTVAGVILGILLTILSISLIGVCIAGIAEGAATVGMAIGVLVSGKSTAAMAVLNVGYGLINFGFALVLLVPFQLLLKKLWNKLKNFMKGAC